MIQGSFEGERVDSLTASVPATQLSIERPLRRGDRLTLTLEIEVDEVTHKSYRSAGLTRVHRFNIINHHLSAGEVQDDD